jgi:Probable cobalt transporter subunit (CbtB)
MAAVAIPRTVPEPIRIPVRELVPWAIFAGVFLLFLLYIVGAEQGAVSLVGGTYIHEFVHDSRHLLGFPCH